LNVEVTPAPVSGPADIEAALTAFARQQNGGLVMLPSLMVTQNRNLIAKPALRLRLPSFYIARAYTASGGLMSYGFVGTEVEVRNGARSNNEGLRCSSRLLKNHLDGKG